MSDLLHEINGTKYLLFSIPVLSGKGGNLNGPIKKHNAIALGVKEINRGGFWEKSVIVFNILVPEENAIAFSWDV